jgi:hypothetical protein
VDEVWKDFLLRIGIVIIGVILAVIATTIVTMAIENGEFAKFSKRRILGIRLLGGVVALTAGLEILNASKTSTPFDLVYAMWLAQVVAGMGAGEGWRRLGLVLKQPPQSEPKVPDKGDLTP